MLKTRIMFNIEMLLQDMSDDQVLIRFISANYRMSIHVHGCLLQACYMI